MVTMVSAWRALYHANRYHTKLPVVVRLPNAATVQSVEFDSIDLEEKTTAVPQRDGNQFDITVPGLAKRPSSCCT